MPKTEDSQLILAEPVEAKQPDSMLAIIDRAVSTPGFDVMALKELLAMKERWDANEAKKAFVSALTKFKDNPPRIPKNKHVHYETSKGVVDYWHTTLDKACEIISKGLQGCGITHRWETAIDGEWISVTCVLTHEMGHSETTTLRGAPDATGSKNGVQAIGSTVTYLQRYTLLAAVGLAAENTDDDGAGGRPSFNAIPEEKVSEWTEWLGNAKDMPELQKMFKSYYSEAAQAKDKTAQGRLIQAKDARKKELS
jgi:ERF superfamily